MDSGYRRLWGWFGLSRASFVVIPRVLMHEMPDEWQDKMAALLEEWDQRVEPPKGETLSFIVQQTRNDGRFKRLPEELCQYRHPMPEIRNWLKEKQS